MQSRRLDRIETTAARLETLLRIIINRQETEMGVLDDLEVEVSGLAGVVESAVTLLDRIGAELRVALDSGDPARIRAAIDELDARKVALAEAVARNTVAEPVPGPGPEPAPVPEPPVES